MEARKKKKRSGGCGLDDKNKHLSADDQDESLCSLSLYAFPLCPFSALPPIKMQNSTQTVSSLQLHKGSQYFSFTPLPCLPTSLTAKWKVMQHTAPYASKSSLSGPLCSTEHIWSSCWMEHLIHPILFIISKAVPHIVCTVTVHQSQLSCLQAWYFPSHHPCSGLYPMPDWASSALFTAPCLRYHSFPAAAICPHLCSLPLCGSLFAMVAFVFVFFVLPFTLAMLLQLSL